MALDQDPMKALADKILRSTVASNAHENQAAARAPTPYHGTPGPNDAQPRSSPSSVSAGGPIRGPPSMMPPEVTTQRRPQAGNNGPSLYGTPESLAEAARMLASYQDKSSARPRGRVLSSLPDKAAPRRAPMASTIFGPIASQSTQSFNVSTPASQPSAILTLSSKRAAAEPLPTTQSPKRNTFLSTSSAGRASAGQAPTSSGASSSSGQSYGAQPALARPTSIFDTAVRRGPKQGLAGQSTTAAIMSTTTPAEAAESNASTDDVFISRVPARTDTPTPNDIVLAQQSPKQPAVSIGAPITTGPKQVRSAIAIRSDTGAEEPVSAAAIGAGATGAAATAETVAMATALEQLTARVAVLEEDNHSLRQEVDQLLQEAERRKFLGTDNARAPYPVTVQLPRIDKSIVVQSTAQLKIGELCRRAFSAAAVDPRCVVNPRLDLNGTDSQLGHLQMLGECGVTQGKTVVLSYDLK